MTPRLFTPEDYAAMVAITNRVYPDYPETVDEWVFQDAHRDPRCRWQRWVIEQDGAVVGLGGYSQWSGMYHPRKFSVSITVDPEYQGRGIGKALYDQVRAALSPLDPLSLRADVREDMARGRRFLGDRGFVEEMREWESRLEVPVFDPAPFAGAEARVRGHGIEIRTYAGLASDPDRENRFYELDWALMQDIPHPEPPTKKPFAVFQERILNHPNFLPNANFIAVHNGEYVGLSALWRSQASADLDTGVTGVRRAYRRKGIALALKLRAIAYAKEGGVPVIKTWNETNNEGMLSLNTRLGFARQPAWIGLVKALNTE